MAVLTKQSIVRSGLNPTYAAAAGGGDQIVPSDESFIHVKNGGGSSITVTVTAPAALAPYPNVTYGNISVAVPAGGERMIGPIKPVVYADPALSGNAAITYSAVTSVTVAHLELSQP